MKKILLSILVAMLLAMSACNNNLGPISDTSDDTNMTIPAETVPLTEEEIDLLNAIGNDLRVISEADYANEVTEMIHHTASYTGQVVQIEGVYSSNLNGDSIPYVYRTLVANGTETTCGLPLVYLETEIPDKAWIRVSAIVGSGEVNGKSVTVLEVIAIESLSKSGQKTVEWTGSAHNH